MMIFLRLSRSGRIVVARLFRVQPFFYFASNQFIERENERHSERFLGAGRPEMEEAPAVREELKALFHTVLR